MARPPHADAEQTRRSIFEQACHLFAERGMRATSMREIASASNVTQASVHHYFGSKQQLYQAAVDHLYRQLAELKQEIAAGVVGDDLHAMIDVAVRSGFRFAMKHRSTALLVTRQVLDEGETASPQRTAALEPFLSQAAALLGNATARDPQSLRLSLLSINYLVIRFALMSPADMSLALSGKRSRRARHDQATVARVESHLVDAAMRLLLDRSAQRR